MTDRQEVLTAKANNEVVGANHEKAGYLQLGETAIVARNSGEPVSLYHKISERMRSRGTLGSN